MKRLTALVLTLLLLCGQTIPAAADGLGPNDPQEIAAFLDPLLSQQLVTYQIPGAVFALVKDGKLLYKQGYGLADVERNLPADADQSLFNVGSITKLFTGTAVMQLVAEGKLDLHADVNQYLTTFKIPGTDPEPITLAHLLTHTAGFGEQNIGMFAPSAAAALPLGEYLARRLPPRVRPAGVEYEYSNHGVALAGYIVEAVSGLPYDQYLAQRIWKPLGMAHTTQSLPESEQIATGYDWKDGRFVPIRRLYANTSPAGGNTRSTAADMASFMLAHLQSGGPILKPETAAQMQSQQWTADPRLPGTAVAFHESFQNGHRVLDHAGDVEGFAAELALVPELGLGIYVAYNGPGGAQARTTLVEQFMDHYYPVTSRPSLPKQDGAMPPTPVAGLYRLNRHERTSFLSLPATVFRNTAAVTQEADGAITLHYPWGDKRWTPVGPLLYQTEQGDLALVTVDGSGKAARLVADGATLERVPWYETPTAVIIQMALLLLLALTGLSGWIVSLRRRQRGAAEATLAAYSGLSALLNLLFMAGYPLVILVDYELGTPLWFRLILWLPQAGAALCGLFALQLIRAWHRRLGSVPARAFYTLCALGSFAFLLFLRHWQLLWYHG